MKNVKSVASFLLSFLLLINTIFFILSLFVSQRLLNPNFYMKNFESQGLYNHIYQSIDKNFTNLTSVTNLPKELFSNVITSEWIKTKNEETIKSTIDYMIYKNDRLNLIDVNEIVTPINSNLDKFKEKSRLILTPNAENELKQIKKDAATIINNQVNFTELSKITKSNSFEKIRKIMYYAYSYKLVLLGIILINIIFILLLQNKNSFNALVWSGYSFLVAALFIIIPCGFGLATKFAYNLNMTEVVIKNIIINVINDSLKYLLYCSSIIGILGLILVMVGIKFSKTNLKEI